MESNESQKGAMPMQSALNYVTIHLTILLASPYIQGDFMMYYCVFTMTVTYKKPLLTV